MCFCVQVLLKRGATTSSSLSTVNSKKQRIFERIVVRLSFLQERIFQEVFVNRP